MGDAGEASALDDVVSGASGEAGGERCGVAMASGVAAGGEHSGVASGISRVGDACDSGTRDGSLRPLDDRSTDGVGDELAVWGGGVRGVG